MNIVGQTASAVHIALTGHSDSTLAADRWGIGFEASVDSNSFDCSNQTKNAIPPADNRQESQWNFTVNNHHSSFAFRTFLDVVLVLVVLVAALAAILWSTLERSMC